MNRLCFAILFLLAFSCSVKEDRTVCPCFLSLKVLRQAEDVFPGGAAWCGLFDGDGTVLTENSLRGMNSRDTLLAFGVAPRRRISAVVSNRRPQNGPVKASEGEEFCALYAFRKELDCLGEEACDSICTQNKEFCTLTVQLSAQALPLAADLVLKVSAPFCGTEFPSLRAARGNYSYRLPFNPAGVAVVRIPRQAGEGLSISVEKPGRFSSEIDLYSIMAASDYDWMKESLSDFAVTVNLNSISGQCAVLDWEIVDSGGRDF